MKRVLHILNSNSYSGAENIAIKIIENLRNYYDFAYLSLNGPIKNVLDKKGIKYYLVDDLNPLQIRKVCKEFKPDIIHAHDFRASVYSALSLYPCVKISHIHHNPPWIKRWGINSIIYSILISLFKYIVVVSNQIKKEAVFLRNCEDKVRLIYNIVDKEEILRLANSEVMQKEYDLIFIGRLKKEKDPLRFIEIIHQLSRDKKDLKVAMLGDGELREECERLICNYGLNNIIDLIGYVQNPYPFIKNSKVLVMTSKWEGFGLVAVEALILGKPVVATPVGGLKEIITSEGGFLCESDSQFVETIIKLLNDIDNYKRESDNCRGRGMRYANVENWLELINSLYEC